MSYKSDWSAAVSENVDQYANINRHYKITESWASESGEARSRFLDVGSGSDGSISIGLGEREFQSYVYQYIPLDMAKQLAEELLKAIEFTEKAVKLHRAYLVTVNTPLPVPPKV